jgi:hypothetical protein
MSLLGSSGLCQFLRLSLFLMVIVVLRTVSLVFCLKKAFDVFLMIRVESHVFLGGSQRSKISLSTLHASIWLFTLAIVN